MKAREIERGYVHRSSRLHPEEAEALVVAMVEADIIITTAEEGIFMEVGITMVVVVVSISIINEEDILNFMAVAVVHLRHHRALECMEDSNHRHLYNSK